MSKFSKISMDDYKLIPALSSHDLMTVIKHPDDWPKYLFEGYHDPVDEKLQARFDLGTLFHTYILEPEDFPEHPDFSRFDVSFDDFKAVGAALTANEKALNLYNNFDKAEYSTDWKCPRTGLYFRGRPDAILKDGSVVDLKTAKNNDPVAFMRSVEAFNYDMQAAFYCDICNTKDFYWIACSLVRHSVHVYKATNEQLGKGWEKNEYAKKKILEYLNQ